MREAPVSENLLLRAVPKRCRTLRKHILFEAGEQFWAAESPLTFVLFPVRGVISLQVVTDGGKQAQAGLVGNEGYAEVPFLLGANRTQTVAMGFTAGEAIVVEPGEFRACLDDRRFRAVINHYARLFIAMLHQMGACNRIHAIDKSVIGRLLLLNDRTSWNHFTLTQEFFSRVLGVRQATISRAATGLQKSGAIRYDRRGKLTILDRGQLEQQACSCYRAMKKDYDGFLATLRRT